MKLILLILIAAVALITPNLVSHTQAHKKKSNAEVMRIKNDPHKNHIHHEADHRHHISKKIKKDVGWPCNAPKSEWPLRWTC